MIKKIFRVILFLLIVALGVFLIKVGLYFQELSSPKYLYKTGIDIIKDNVDTLVKPDNKYILGDNFSAEGSIDFELSSDTYKTKGLTDEKYIERNNFVNNLTKMDINYIISQDEKNKKLYLSLDEKIKEESILNYKLYVQDSTEYLFVKSVLDNYINYGSNNYFELFGEEETTITNINYLYEFICDDLATQLGKEASKYEKTTNIDNKPTEVNQVSVKLTNNTVKKILSGILKDLKKDEKASKILTNMDDEFPDKKIDDEKEYLQDDESYTINIYTNKTLNKPLKYEILYVKGDNKKVFSYEGSSSKGVFYFSDNDETKYSGKFTKDGKNYKIDVYDRLQKDAGNITISKDANNIMFNMSVVLDDKSYDIVFSSKYKDYEKNKGYTVDSEMSLKLTDGGKVDLGGEIKSQTKVTKEVNIDVDTSKSVLKSTLTEPQKEKIDNLYEDVKGRLQNG